ncbi:hypothetical protein AKJ37_05680 [candidate division MSBL1 archaeon SCGC-AAA259I09]|uniref:Uncharacterized protein n=1 Tax=candidate division MSBL1 archaeon SCGC-AAA259I09 TaxID=1698267 RepID=A0A133UPV4_9EURY|nr:hypothetical protein AKJ37_05680 [candidate division MSBL1 archaeon SCGC-AAA259I09]
MGGRREVTENTSRRRQKGRVRRRSPPARRTGGPAVSLVFPASPLRRFPRFPASLLPAGPAVVFKKGGDHCWNETAVRLKNRKGGECRMRGPGGGG